MESEKLLPGEAEKLLSNIAIFSSVLLCTIAGEPTALDAGHESMVTHRGTRWLSTSILIRWLPSIAPDYIYFRLDENHCRREINKWGIRSRTLSFKFPAQRITFHLYPTKTDYWKFFATFVCRLKINTPDEKFLRW